MKKTSKKNKQSSDKKSNTLFVVLGAVAVAIVGVFFLFPNEKKPERKVKHDKTVKVQKSSESSSLEYSESSSTEPSSSTASFDNPKDTALATLETNETVSEQDTQVVKDAIAKAIEYISKTEQAELVPEFSAHLQQTDLTAMRTVKALESVGYHYKLEDTQVVRSKTNGVLQYTFSYVNDENKVVTFTGNYSVGSGQLQIQNWYGDLSFMAKE